MRKKELNILIASGVGLFTVLALVAVRKFLKSNPDTIIDEFRLFSTEEEEPQHGVEYYSMK